MDATAQTVVDETIKLADTIRERAEHHDRTGEFPHENLKALEAVGALDACIPKKFGGLATDALFCGELPTRLVYEVARACAGTAWSLLSHYHATGQIAGVATPAQQEKIFAEVIQEKKRIATIGSEINIKDTKDVEDKTLAIRSGGARTNGDYTINGFKGFTSTARYADYIVYWHMEEGSNDPNTGLLFSLIPRDREGIEFLPGWEDAMGIRCSASGPAKFTDMTIHEHEVLGGPGDWIHKHPLTHDILYAAVLTGIARETYDNVVKAVSPRRDMWQDRAVMNYLGEMSSQVQAAEWSLERSAQEWERGGDFGAAHHATLRALHVAKQTASQLTNRAFEVVGTRAVLRTAPFERLWRDARVASLHTREWQHMGWVARGDMSGERFSKEKYGTPLEGVTQQGSA